MLTQAVILAGGYGTRLGQLCSDTPKPLLQVGGVPFLEYIVWNLKRHGIREILFSVGYLAKTIQEHFGNGAWHGVHIDYAVEEQPAGTGGALVLAREKLASCFLVLNGDTLFDINYLDLVFFHSQARSLVSLALREINDVKRYGQIRVEDGIVVDFQEKSGDGAGLINGGVYVIEKQALDYLSNTPASLENDLFPLLASEGKMYGRKYDAFFIDIGLPQSLQLADNLLPKWKIKPAVFFDRDGVLNVDKGYVHKAEDFEWIEGAREAIKYFNDKGYFVFVVTNQAGIARGYYSEEHFNNFTTWISNELYKIGAHIDEVYYCPHHPTEGLGRYRKVCMCRKPESGMILSALEGWPVDKERSFIVGDKDSDIVAAKKVGIKGLLFQSGNLIELIKKYEIELSHLSL